MSQVAHPRPAVALGRWPVLAAAAVALVVTAVVLALVLSQGDDASPRSDAATIHAVTLRPDESAIGAAITGGASARPDESDVAAAISPSH